MSSEPHRLGGRGSEPTKSLPPKSKGPALSRCGHMEGHVPHEAVPETAPGLLSVPPRYMVKSGFRINSLPLDLRQRDSPCLCRWNGLTSLSRKMMLLLTVSRTCLLATWVPPQFPAHLTSLSNVSGAPRCHIQPMELTSLQTEGYFASFFLCKEHSKWSCFLPNVFI